MRRALVGVTALVSFALLFWQQRLLGLLESHAASPPPTAQAAPPRGDVQIGPEPFGREAMRVHFRCWVRSVYKQHQDVQGGIGLFHAWYLTFVIHSLAPEVVIESGAFQGYGTRFIRWALGPKGRIIVVSPEHPTGYVDPEAEYFTGKRF